MTEEDLYERIDPVLQRSGMMIDDGEEFREPALDILRYYQRPIRLHWVPVVGSGRSVLAVVRQPVDVGIAADGYSRLVRRLAMAAHGRYPPWPSGPGLAIGLTAIILTPEPIRPEDDDALDRALASLKRSRIVPIGLFRLNLGQQAMAHSLATVPGGPFPEPTELAETLAETFRRFVPLLPPGCGRLLEPVTLETD
ncbi:hypothetical protein BH23PLA1_BH23PLA1_22970 [soil metagenome]